MGHSVSSAWTKLSLLVLLLSVSAQAQSDPAQAGEWSAVKSWPEPAVHAHVLPTGNVLIFTEFEKGAHGPYLWTPETDTLQQLSPPGYNIFCAGHAFLPDGRLLIAGGHIEVNQGLPNALLFDPFTSSWTRLPDMEDGRWYPTVTTLPNGEMLAVAGFDENQGVNLLPEIWSSETGSWRRLTGASRLLYYYPWMFVAPDGRLFMAGSTPATGWLDTSGAGAWVNRLQTRYNRDRNYGSATMYEPGKILIVGGDDPPTHSAEVINLNDPSPAWRSVAPLSHVRRQHNATLLPDGSVLVTGGHGGTGIDDPTHPRLETEWWDPVTETWSTLAPMGTYRGYHSVALLLPDGRVLSAGGLGGQTMQVFSPPYLFRGARPVITSAPDVLNYGQGFMISTAEAASIAQVTLVRLPSVTHAFDQNQRFFRMSFQAGSESLAVTAPTQPNLAPPGHYMMFLVNSQGVPSVAKIIRLGGSAPPPPPPPPPSGAVAIPFGSTWKYDDRNVDPGPQWMTPGYDDSAWSSGPAQLGYGDGDERTVLHKSSPSQPSVYFRKKFFVDGTVQDATLKMLFDDGFAVWVNGTQVLSRNISRTTHSAYAYLNSGDNARMEAVLPTSSFVHGFNTIAVMVKQVAGSSSDVSFDLELTLRTSKDVVIPFGSTWKYDDRNVDPGPAWTSASFDDSGWREGPGQLGYGDGDEHTVLQRTPSAQPSVYFRKKVFLSGAPSAARIRVVLDDGFALWVNGRQVASRNVASTSHSSYATESAENLAYQADLDASAFVAGENTLAVMIKQRGPDSSDISFDLELSLTGP
jgi:galactose oxidase